MLNAQPEPTELRGLARWDGSKWDSVGMAEAVTGFVFDQVIFQDELYVMGRFDRAGSDMANSIAMWDGVSWHILEFPYTIFENGGEISILSSYVHNSELFVAGNFWNEDESVRDVAKYDGSEWHPVGNGIRGGQMMWLTLYFIKMNYTSVAILERLVETLGTK